LVYKNRAGPKNGLDKGLFETEEAIGNYRLLFYLPGVNA
jgi:hypothetical protein